MTTCPKCNADIVDDTEFMAHFSDHLQQQNPRSTPVRPRAQKPAFIVQDLLRPYGVVAWGSPPKGGKSQLCLGELSRSIANGTNYLGLKTRKGVVMVIDQDHQEERGFEDEMVAFGLEGHPRVHILRMPRELMDTGEEPRFYGDYQSHRAHLVTAINELRVANAEPDGNLPDAVLLIDSFTRWVSSPEKVLDPKGANRWIGWIKEIQRGTDGAAVGIINHVTTEQDRKGNVKPASLQGAGFYQNVSTIIMLEHVEDEAMRPEELPEGATSGSRKLVRFMPATGRTGLLKPCIVAIERILNDSDPLAPVTQEIRVRVVQELDTPDFTKEQDEKIASLVRQINEEEGIGATYPKLSKESGLGRSTVEKSVERLLMRRTLVRGANAGHGAFTFWHAGLKAEDVTDFIAKKQVDSKKSAFFG